MKRLRPPLVALSVVLAAFLFPAPVSAQLDEAGGGTVVTVEGRIVQITVNIDVIVPDGSSQDPPGYFESLIRDGFSAAAALWNAGMRRTLANGCYSVELSLAIRFVEANMAAGGGHDTYIQTYVHPQFSRPIGMTEGVNHDTAEVFSTNGTLYLPYWALPDTLTLAHELGHLFGLADDYTRHRDGTTTALPGREGTLMGDQADYIDQALINRIGDLAQRSGTQLPQCWKGTATVASSAVYPQGSASCQDGWDLEFTFVASAEGTIDGQGTAELTSGPTCTFPIGPSLEHYEYQVLGEETADGFTIRFALGTFGPAGGAEYAGFVSMFGFPAPPSGGPPVAVAVSGTSGTGQGEWRFRSGNPPATYSANGTVRLECLTCEAADG